MYSALDEAWPAFETFTSNTPKLDCKYIQEHLQECSHCRNMCLGTVKLEHMTATNEVAPPKVASQAASMLAATSKPEFKDVMLAYLLGVLILSIMVRE